MMCRDYKNLLQFDRLFKVFPKWPITLIVDWQCVIKTN